MAKRKINIDGAEISMALRSEGRFVCLTDMARKFSAVPSDVLKAWMRSSANIAFLGTWEIFNNPVFNQVAYNQIKNDSTANAFTLSVKQWTEETGAVGIYGEAGRYGGTYAHQTIAVQFATWLDPVFYLYVAQEFERLKSEEAARLASGWDLKRTLSKINYLIHTDAVRERLIPLRIQNTRAEGLFFASEADLLNVALFGLSAKEWREANPDLKGNLRDNASAEQLLVLANLENLNAEMIRQGLGASDRLHRLNEIAIHQLELLLRQPPGRLRLDEADLAQ